MLEDLERQLDERRPAEQREVPQPPIASAKPSSLSIADELRELQRAPEVPRSPIRSPLTPRALDGVDEDPSERGTRQSLSDREWNRRSQQRRPDRSMDLSRKR